ncbi:Gag-pol polyprotein [Elysia marginata]|uniref:Gag-pol polyprotein n=1 Tax=Elysia marginata TaxID=1093978 RepID=A0AAV4HCB2_9GAST|nr:Gag-pol polyprotein [Elysia marginata]
MDDILIYSKNRKEHEKHLEETTKKLNAAGVKLNDIKCVYRQKEIDFLGSQITKDGVKPSAEKIKAILANKHHRAAQNSRNGQLPRTVHT